jgi:serine protease inhibitor
MKKLFHHTTLVSLKAHNKNWRALVVVLVLAAVLHTNSADNPTSALQTATAGNSAFALDLYQQLRTGEGNLFFSPLSLSTTLAMTYAGARFFCQSSDCPRDST